jgi:hypothetical protein
MIIHNWDPDIFLFLVIKNIIIEVDFLSQSRQSAKLFSIVGIGTPPTPHSQASMPHPSRFWGEGHNRWRERGWESPNSDEGTYTVVLFIYTYFVFFVVEKMRKVIE